MGAYAKFLPSQFAPAPAATEPDPLEVWESDGGNAFQWFIPGAQSISRFTREDWLVSAIDALRPLFRARGYVIPDRVRVSVGFPMGRGRKPIGQCWSPMASETAEMFISPILDDAARVLDVLVHELGHACLGNKVGHGKAFGAFCRKLYLAKPWTATTAQPGRFEEEIVKPVFCAIPFAYPHRRMIPGMGGIGKQSARLLKCVCPDCGYTARITAKWIAQGLPTCPNDGSEIEPA